MERLSIPLSDSAILALTVGEPVLLNGIMITGRDRAHKWMVDTFITGKRKPVGDDLAVYEAIKPVLRGGVLYHCGPVVSGLDDRNYRFVAAGPTTSIREEPYEGDVMRHFHVQGIVGKGGMGAQTLAACRDVPGVYFHAIGGAASLIAQTVRRVLGVYKLDFGVPEAMWVIEVQDFPAVVTMDAHGRSLHEEVEKKSREILQTLIA